MVLVPPIRSRLIDESGAMTRQWVVYFTELARQTIAAAAGLATNLEVALTDGSGTDVISSAGDPVAGAVLALTLTQGTGGRQIAYSAQFAADCGVDILMGAGETTRKLFVGGSDNLWHDFSIFGA